MIMVQPKYLNEKNYAAVKYISGKVDVGLVAIIFTVIALLLKLAPKEAIRSGIMDGMKELNIRIIWHLLLSQPEKYHMLQVLEKVN